MRLDRKHMLTRQFTAGRLFVSALMLCGADSASAATKEDAKWREDLAVQLWSYNSTLGSKTLSATPKMDVPAALARIKARRIHQIEAVSLPDYTPTQLRAALDKAGVRAISTQIDYERVRDDLPSAIAEAETLGARQFGISAIKIFGPQGYHLLNIADTVEAGQVLSKTCAANMRVFLHTHGNALHMLDGKTALDRIIENAGGCFDIEADIY